LDLLPSPWSKERWLHGIIELFDDWVWDGRDLTLFLHNKAIERYSRKTLTEAIPSFPTTTTARKEP
jgi:hypothetical protein